MKYILIFRNWLLDWIFSPCCAGCGVCGKYLCDNCYSKIEEGRDERGVICCAKYDKNGTLAKLITRMKYSGISDMAKAFRPFLRLGAKILAGRLRSDGYTNLDELIILPVPISRKRGRQRGFNQAEILAKMLQQELERETQGRISICTDTLLKADRPKQSTLKRVDRLSNLEGAITLGAGGKMKITGKIIIIVDDVATTLSTLNECRRALTVVGPRAVYFVVLARARSL